MHRNLAKQAARLAGLGLVLGTMPGCQSISGSPSLSLVRVIYTSPDEGGLDIYEGSSVLIYNVGFPTVTSYVPVVPDNYVISANATGSKQQVISSRGSFNVNNQYTVLIGNYAANLQETILQDQAQAAPSGQIALRFLDQAPAAGSVDIYLVPSGSTLLTAKPILTGVNFTTNTGYIDVQAGTYTLVVLPTGTVASATTVASYTGTAVTYAGGAVRTVVMFGEQLLTSPAIQVKFADDYDAPGTTA